jgi:hypothetical protein
LQGYLGSNIPKFLLFLLVLNITPRTVATQFRNSNRRKVSLIWYSFSVLSGCFLYTCLIINFLYGGCENNPKNRITFFPVTIRQSEVLFYSPLKNYWNKKIKSMYNSDFNVVHYTDLKSSFSNDLCGTEKPRPFFSIRYEYSFISWTFLYVGVIGAVDFLLNTIHSIVLLYELNHEETEENEDDNHVEDEDDNHVEDDVEQEMPMRIPLPGREELPSLWTLEGHKRVMKSAPEVLEMSSL